MVLAGQNIGALKGLGEKPEDVVYDENARG